MSAGRRWASEAPVHAGGGGRGVLPPHQRKSLLGRETRVTPRLGDRLLTRHEQKQQGRCARPTQSRSSDPGARAACHVTVSFFVTERGARVPSASEAAYTFPDELPARLGEN